MNDNAVGPYSNYRIGSADGYSMDNNLAEVLAFSSPLSEENRLKGEDAGIHLRVVLPAKNKGKEPTTLSRRIDLPGKDQPIECGTCHGGKLHFLTQE
ncbi:MAG TPA: hypothetical protein EYQ31_11640 [Candidatus Handelsmanbacteria bacterium]|nr:hypothetical protein [Candidatus Handelsmanbacteria bacterium]